MSLWLVVVSIFMSAAADIRWNSTFSSETHLYYNKLPAPTRTTDPILWVKPELDIKFNKTSRIYLKPTLRANPASSDKQEQVFFNPAEMYWDIKLNPVRIDLGYNVHNWGVLDGYSPLDIVNGRVLFNPLASSRRGSGMVDLQYTNDWFKVEGLYIPRQSRTLLPSTDSRWLPRSFILNSEALNETVLLPASFNYYYPGYMQVDHALNNNFGLKISSTLGSFDLNVVYFNGMSNNTQVAPTFQADVVSLNPNILQARTDIGLTPVYFRTETYGANLVWAPEDFVIRLETAYARTTKTAPTLPEWSWQSGVALELPINFSRYTLTSVFQFYYGKNKDPAENLVSSSSRVFDRAFLIGERIEWTASLSSLLTYMHDYKNNGYYLMFNSTYSLTDSLKMTLQLDTLGGNKNSLFGTYDKNDRTILTLSYLL